MRTPTALALGLLLSTSAATSQSRVAPDFGLEGTAGATRWLHQYAGRVVVLVYEDRDGAPQNETLKRELAQRARRTNLASRVALVPIANLQGYGWWPARSFARDAVVRIAREQHHEILIDWSGQVARAYGFAPHASHILVLGGDRTVLFRADGALDAAGRAEFFRVLDAALATP